MDPLKGTETLKKHDKNSLKSTLQGCSVAYRASPEQILYFVLGDVYLLTDIYSQ